MLMVVEDRTAMIVDQRDRFDRIKQLTIIPPHFDGSLLLASCWLDMEAVLLRLIRSLSAIRRGGDITL